MKCRYVGFSGQQNIHGIHTCFREKKKKKVYYDLHKELFKSNLNLDVGKTAHWKVEQVLGAPDQFGQPEALVSYVRCLLLLVEKCQPLRV